MLSHHEGTKDTKVSDNKHSELPDLGAFVMNNSVPDFAPLAPLREII